MKNDNLKQKLKNGETTIGSWITLAHPAIAEIMAASNFDWLTVDLEHSVITIRECEDLIRAIELSGVTPLVRLTSNDANQIKRVMDSGACGVIVPLVNTKEQAEQAVAATYYPTKGRRGVGLARAQRYGPQGFEIYKKNHVENNVVIVMIEHIEAVKNMEEILAVDGVDGFILGPYDLSGSMGKAGQFDDPEVEQAIQHVLEVGKKCNKPGGIHIIEPEPEQLKQRIEQGFRFIAYSIDTRMIDTSCRQVLRFIKK